MPIMPQYRSPYGQSIAELLMRQGEIAARGAERSGAIWGNAIQNLGQVAGQAYEQHREQKDWQKQQAGISAALSSWDGKDLGRLYRSTVPFTKSPQDAMRFVNSVVAFQELGVKQDERNQERLGVALGGVDLLPDDVFVKVYPELRAKAQAAGFDVGQFPEQPDVKMKPVLGRLGMALRGEKPTERGPENPENVVINGQATVATPSEIAKAKAQGATVTPYNAPTKPETVNPASFEAFVVGKYGDQPTPEQMVKARAEWASAGREPDRPQATRFTRATVMVGGKPVLANYDSASGRYFDVNTGKTLTGIDPAGEGSNTNKFSGATAALQAIGELSAKINTQQGLTAKISGAAERAKAQANMADDVAEYQAVVMSFTPLLARMMGHTGVLTEQDVVSTRQILPKPEDSKSVRDRKMKRIEAILGGQAGMVTTTPTEPPSGPQPIKDASDYANLPSGTEYVDPQGVRRRKR